MKLLKSLSLILLTTVVLISCSKKDDNVGDITSLIGTWKLTASKTNGVPDVLSACELKSTVIFGSTTIKVTGYDGVDCDERYEMEGTYTRSGNTLTVVFPGNDVSTVEINKLTATTLEITHEDEEDGVEVQTYSRQ